jgi:hypothetical protein
MARTVRHDPSPARVALVNRGGKGFHGGNKRAQRKRNRKAARQQLRAAY